MATRDQITGEMIRRWRKAQGFSQASLSALARTSARHLSFVENGRSTPSEALLERLCKTLRLSAGDRHALLQSAGYGSPYAPEELDSVRGSQLSRALDVLLEKMRPYPGGVLDSHFNLVQCNPTAERFFDTLIQKGIVQGDGGSNILSVLMGPGGLAQYIVNRHEMTQRLINRLNREEAIGNANETMSEMRERLRAEQAAKGVDAAPESDSHPIMRFEIERDDLRLQIDGIISTIGTPTDASFQHLRLSCFVPADAATEACFEELAASV